MVVVFCRMVLAREKELVMPLKWCSLPQCFRFENVQVIITSLVKNSNP